MQQNVEELCIGEELSVKQMTTILQKLQVKWLECQLSTPDKIQALFTLLSDVSQCTEEVIIMSPVKLAMIKDMTEHFLSSNRHVKTLNIGLGMKQISMKDRVWWDVRLPTDYEDHDTSKWTIWHNEF